MNTSFGRIVGAAAVILAALAHPADVRAQSQSDETVRSLLQAGWAITRKTDANEWHKGVAPYEKLGRMIYVVTYTLEKDGQRRVCTMSRDMMFDTSTQSCARAK